MQAVKKPSSFYPVHGVLHVSWSSAPDGSEQKACCYRNEQQGFQSQRWVLRCLGLSGLLGSLFFFRFSFDLIKHDSKSDFISPGLIQLPPIYGVKRPHTQMDKSHTLVVEPVLVHTRIRAGDVGLRA